MNKSLDVVCRASVLQCSPQSDQESKRVEIQTEKSFPEGQKRIVQSLHSLHAPEGIKNAETREIVQLTLEMASPHSSEEDKRRRALSVLGDISCTVSLAKVGSIGKDEIEKIFNKVNVVGQFVKGDFLERVARALIRAAAPGELENYLLYAAGGNSERFAQQVEECWREDRHNDDRMIKKQIQLESDFEKALTSIGESKKDEEERLTNDFIKNKLTYSLAGVDRAWSQKILGTLFRINPYFFIRNRENVYYKRFNICFNSFVTNFLEEELSRDIVRLTRVGHILSLCFSVGQKKGMNIFFRVLGKARKSLNNEKVIRCFTYAFAKDTLKSNLFQSTIKELDKMFAEELIAAIDKI